MKIGNIKFFLVAGFLTIALSLSLPQSLFQGVAWAQDIDDVIQQLEPDFDLGSSKDEVKRNNVNAANEQNREDIKIKEQEGQTGGTNVVMVDIILHIEEAGFDSSITVELVGGSTLATGIIGSSTQVNFQLPAGSTQSLKITCAVSDACGSWLYFIKGATFIGSAEGPNGFFDSLAAGAMVTTQFKVNADNSGPTTMAPAPPI